MPAAPRRSSRSPSPRCKPYDYGPCPSDITAQSKYFYATCDAESIIVNNVHSTSTELTTIPENIMNLRFDHRKWQNTPRPANYHGLWPPTSASQLMNTNLPFDSLSSNRLATQFHKKHGDQITEDCLGKFCWQEANLPSGIFCLEASCTHTFSEWLTGSASWRERFSIHYIPNMGYGLYSRANPKTHWKGTWKPGDVLGAYLGELLPERTINTDYCHEVTIGPEFEKMRAPVAYIDAGKCGNYVRFCNHSCESNAKIFEARVGKERVLALRAIKAIGVGDQICIDYGSDYFRGRRCLCGSQKCKYPNAVNPIAEDVRLDKKRSGCGKGKKIGRNSIAIM